MRRMAGSESSRIKQLSLSNLFLSGLSLPLQVITSSVKHLQKLELLNCHISTVQCESLFQSLSREENFLRELNLTNTQIVQLDPSLLAQCSLRLEKICLSDLTENQTLRIFKSLSMAKSSRLKALRLEGVTEFGNWCDEGSYLCNAISKLENFSIKFKQTQSSTSLRATSFRLFVQLLILNDRKCLEEISIYNGRFTLLCDQGKTGNCNILNFDFFYF